MRFAKRDGDFQRSARVFTGAAGLLVRVQALDQVKRGAQVHALDALGIGELAPDSLGPPPALDLPVSDPDAVRVPPEPTALAYHLHRPLGAASRHHAHERAHPVVEGYIAVAHQVVVRGRLLVALHLAEDPAGLATGQIADEVEHVAAVVRDGGPAIRRNLHDRPD